MSVENSVGEPSQSRLTQFVRLACWVNLAVMAAFLINVFLANGAGFPGSALVTGASGLRAWLQLSLYPLGAIAAFLLVLRTPGITLRHDADRFTAINNYLIRAAFWAVLLIGVFDFTLTFLRIEGFLELWIGDEMTRNFGRSHFRGQFLHVPLILLSFIIAALTRTLGFHWLALLIVIAELAIVFSRFIFSYEQAFMGDLVRFWYGALFLFASAYTLVEEGHVRVDVLYASFSDTTKGMVNAVGTITMGIALCWTILIIGMSGPASIINAPVFNFEVTQSSFGLYVKYMMAAFLGIFAISMMIQFMGYMMSAIADWRGDPGHVNHETVAPA